MEKMLMLKKKMNKRRPRFVRQEGHSKKMLKKVWRKPKGYHSKIRRKFAGHRKMPESGYRSPRAVRGLTLQGFNPVLVKNVAEAAALVAKRDGAIIAKVGKKAKVEILRRLLEAKVKILNELNPEKFVSDIEDEIRKRQDEKKAKEEKKKKSKEESLKQAAEKKKTKEEVKSEEDKKKEQIEEHKKLLETPK